MTTPSSVVFWIGFINISWRWGNKVSDVKVTVDGTNAVLTDDEGYFCIDNVKSGIHLLNLYQDINKNQIPKITDGDTTGFVEKTIEIQVDSDVLLNSLILPNPVYLHKTDSDTTIRIYDRNGTLKMKIKILLI